jgi:hypothetical protein
LFVGAILRRSEGRWRSDRSGEHAGSGGSGQGPECLVLVKLKIAYEPGLSERDPALFLALRFGLRQTDSNSRHCVTSGSEPRNARARLL